MQFPRMDYGILERDYSLLLLEASIPQLKNFI